MEEKKERKHLRFPITVKTVIMIAVFGLALAEIAMIYFSLVSSNRNNTNYKQLATDLSNTVALSLDKEKVANITNQCKSIYDEYDEKPTRAEEGTELYKEYMAKFDAVRSQEDYKSLQSYLKSIKDVNIDTEGIYLAFVDYQRAYAIYIVYDTETELYPTGIIDELYEEDMALTKDPEIGFVASIYDAEVEGVKLVTAGVPVHDKDGNIICYTLVDISLQNVRNKQADNIIRLFFYLMITVVVLSGLGILVVHFTLIKPVKTLQDAAKSYDVNNPEKTHEKFKELKVNTHDEFSDLAESMKAMENDINIKISELVKTNDELIQSQRVVREMTELANKDALTGVKNKLVYQKAIALLDEKIKRKEQLAFGIAMVDLNYLKQINDEYGHNNGDAALVKLCNLICAIFAHSPVYRIGGDEFAVLLRNRDYQCADELINIFNSKIDELWEDQDLPLYERISAAIGYSKYDPSKHTSAEDVFKEADHNMYIRKWEMKQHH